MAEPQPEPSLLGGAGDYMYTGARKATLDVLLARADGSIRRG
jgi:hypothetical protein